MGGEAILNKPAELPRLDDWAAIERSTSRDRDALLYAEKLSVVSSLSMALYPELEGRKLELDSTSSIAGKDSAHDVFFARTATRDANGKRRTIACKRFRRAESAMDELSSIAEAKARGFDTLEPVGYGVYTMEGIGEIVVTEKRSRFTTMNQVGWADHYAGQPDYEAKIVPVLHSIADFVGTMHRQGIIHDDLQLKNIGQVPPSNFVLFDLEGASFYPPVTESTSADMHLLDKTTHDMAVLVNSLVSRGFLWNSTDQMFRDEVTNHLLLPYLEKADMHDEQVIDKLDHILEFAISKRPEVHKKFAEKAVRHDFSSSNA